MKDKVTFSADQLVSSSQLVRGMSKYLDTAKDQPLFIQRDQTVGWVLLSLEDYEDLRKGNK